MKKLENAAQSFLKLSTIAVAGVSSHGDVAANTIYKALRKKDYSLFAINPNATCVEGDKCYPNLKSLPKKVEGVVIATHPEITPQIVDECIELNIQYIWIHQSFGLGSYNSNAVKKALESGISIIPGGCPMMFLNPVDPAHKCMRWFLKISGKEAQPVGFVD